MVGLGDSILESAGVPSGDRQKKNGQKTVEGRRSLRGRPGDVDVITGLHLGCSTQAPPTHTVAIAPACTLPRLD